MKFKIETLSSYTVMPNTFLDDKRISLKAKGLLATFYRLPNDWDYSVNGLCKITNTGITAIRNILAELELYGYLIRKQERTIKGTFEYIYYIFLEPKKVSPMNCTSLRKTKQYLDRKFLEFKREKENNRI